MPYVRKITNDFSKKINFLDTEIILGFALNKSREFLYSHPEYELTSSQYKKFQQLIKRRLKGEPIAYITGHKEFYGLNFIVDNNVLIPRPDTEIIIDEILRYNFPSENHSGSLRILDMGTGSGCIAITLKKLLPKTNVIATDISKKVVNIANKNAKKHNANIDFYVSNLFRDIPKKYHNKLDIIIFNPPYLTKNESKKASLKYEPQIALTPDSFPKLLDDFFKQSLEYIAENGQIFMEIGHKQFNLTKKIASKYYPQAKFQVFKDLGGYDRVLRIFNTPNKFGA
ncbi:MAG: peptide chain release factor N(5)-glutamine methyltransferase [Patescibacteria group bacterium]